jgi:protein phosphatase
MKVLARQAIIEAAAITHRGSVRDRNEDTVSLGGVILTGDMESARALRVDGEKPVLMIADGMGGHARGELASRLVLETLQQFSHLSDVLEWRNAIQSANDRIYDFMLERPEFVGLGSTLVGVAFCSESLIIFNVGDSRAYRHSFGKLQQLTHDDVLDMPRTGRQARTHQITQSLGGRMVRTRVSPHVRSSLPLSPDETILLCSDGLTDMVPEKEMLRALDSIRPPPECADYLLQLALAGGGSDNVSIILARSV